VSVILLLNQFFPPDPAPTGALLADLARALAAQDESVTVVCDAGGYAHAPETCPPDAVPLDGRMQVLRLRGLRFSHGPAARMMSWCAFLAGALWRGLRVPVPDAVVTLTTPPLLSLVGTVLGRRGARHIIWEMDLYPDVAVALGAVRAGSLADRITGALADWSRRHAGAIVVLGPCMKRRLVARGIPPGKIHVAENWAGSSKIRPLPHNRDGRLKVLYSGNLGLAHDTETIAGAMKALAGHPGFRFTFAGGGPRRKALEDFCRANALANVAFEPYKDASELSGHLGSCDIGLVTQNPATLGCVVPSKTYALMAARRPFVFVGPRDATPALNIERFGCGWQIDPGDVDGLVSLLKLLAAEPELVREAGRRAYAAFREHYDLPQGVARIAEIIRDRLVRPAVDAPACPDRRQHRSADAPACPDRRPEAEPAN